MTGQAGQPAAEPDEDEIEQAQGHGRSSCRTPDPQPVAAVHRSCRLLAPHRLKPGAWRTHVATISRPGTVTHLILSAVKTLS